MDVFLPVFFTTETHYDQVEQDFPGTNRCESRTVTHLLTLQTSVGTFRNGGFTYLKVGLEIVNKPCLLGVLVSIWYLILERSFFHSSCPECLGDVL